MTRRWCVQQGIPFAPQSSPSMQPGSVRPAENGGNFGCSAEEFILELNQTPSLKRGVVECLFRDLIHKDGGPLIDNNSEEEQHSFDSTCPNSTASRLNPISEPAGCPQFSG